MNKFVEKDSVVDLISRLKSEGKSIVFTNGCFDIVHAGHVDYLEKAKTFGDVLFVGVNSDTSVKKIKGGGRPVVSEGYRIRLLEGIEAINYISVFSEDTPIELIKRIKPDIIVKGADWRDRGVVGEDFVKTYGGKVELVGLLPGISTTVVIENILKNYS